MSDAHTKKIIDNPWRIFDKINVRLCQNLSAKYALGISSKNDAKKPSPVYIHNWVAVVLSNVRKYIDNNGIKFLLWENKNIPNLVWSENTFSNIIWNHKIALNIVYKKRREIILFLFFFYKILSDSK